MKPVKVLFFQPNTFYGSIVSVFGQIIQHLDRSRVAPYVVFNSEANGDLNLRALEGATIRRWNFGQGLRGSRVNNLRSAVHVPASLVALARYARREGIDIVQCSPTPLAGTLGLSLARLSGARMLAHCQVIARDYGLPKGKAGPRQIFETAVLRRADHLVAISGFLANQIRDVTGISPGKIDVVVNGVDLDRFHPRVDGSAIRQAYRIAPDAPLVVQVARISRQKRQEDVVRAFAIARRSAPNLRCLLVGSEASPLPSGPFPDYTSELRHICEQENLGDSLIMTPARADVPEVMAAADIVVMPSINEAWGLVVTEAMAAGKPVIGADSGGIPEQIVDGETGFVTPARSSEALAEKMILLAQDAGLRARMGRASRRRAETHFGEACLAAGFTPIYEALRG